MTQPYHKLVNTLRMLHNSPVPLTDSEVIDEFVYIGGNFGKHKKYYNSIALKPPKPLKTNKCLCGKKNVKHFGYLQHRNTLKTIRIGGSCIKRYLPENFSKTCAGQIENENGIYEMCGKPHDRISFFCLECDKRRQKVINKTTKFFHKAVFKDLEATDNIQTFTQNILDENCTTYEPLLFKRNIQTFTQNVIDDNFTTYEQLLFKRFNDERISDDTTFILDTFKAFVKYRQAVIREMQGKVLSNGETCRTYMAKNLNRIRYRLYDTNLHPDLKFAVVLYHIMKADSRFKKNNRAILHKFE